MLNRIRLVVWMWVGILGSAGMKTVIFHFLVGESGYTKLRIPSLVCTPLSISHEENQLIWYLNFLIELCCEDIKPIHFLHSNYA